MDKQNDLSDIDELNYFEITSESSDEPVQSVVNRFEDGELVIDVDCQRHFVWDTKRASRLIESLLIGIPIPIFYCFEGEEDSELIDGKQRFLSMYEFLNNKFKLSGLENLAEYNNLYFKDLPKKMQKKIKTYKLHIYSIEAKNEDAKYEIFSRLNTGGVKLGFEELVLGTNEGSLTQFAKKVSTKLIDHGTVRNKDNVNKKIDFHVLRALMYTRENINSGKGVSKRKEIAGFFKDEHWANHLTESRVDGAVKLLSVSYESSRVIRELMWPETRNKTSKDNLSLHIMLVHILSRIPIGIRYNHDVVSKVESIICDTMGASEDVINSFKSNTGHKKNRDERQKLANTVLSNFS
ncbi:GmrSD restriction endonuclease domain-containing protein [Vibrio crassostreae]|uniref:GmrSD restriction endonuclease domain-containing protein n=1 Tax=Vibrio crassostreae TaxID=246167 RepID=UPI001B304943|nr:DUF262 domain-containing protein [Vibrio crassostreae]